MFHIVCSLIMKLIQFNHMRSSTTLYHQLCRSDATHDLTYKLRRNSQSVGHVHHSSVTAAVCGIHRRHVYDDYSLYSQLYCHRLVLPTSDTALYYNTIIAASVYSLHT